MTRRCRRSITALAALLAALAGPVASADDTACSSPLPPPQVAVDLPGLLRLPDGQPVSAGDWPCQRQRLLATAQAHVYGAPGPVPDRVSARIEAERIRVEVDHGGRRVGFEATVRRPPGPGPHPVLIVVGGVAGVPDGLLMSEGIARIDFVPTQVGAETGQSRARQGAFFELYGEPVLGTGTLAAWAWGVSRLVDAIGQAGSGLRVDAVAVAGCSRYGKGALVAGAFDERIALTIPIESGSGGVPLWRAVAAGAAQPPGSAFGEQPWLGDGFGAFAGDVGRLPIDQHAILALVAPRGLLVLDNPHLGWLGADAGHASAQAAAGVYALLGAAGNLGYHGDVVDQTHCAWRAEWDEPARHAIRRHLRGIPAPDLTLVPLPARPGAR
jgi:hypothetical protein